MDYNKNSLINQYHYLVKYPLIQGTLNIKDIFWVIFMKASEIQLLKFLSAPKQLIIPIYQRTYSWQKQQCKKFFDDIMSVGSDPDASGHFLGSIVYIENELYHVSDLTKLLVIDGQQRLTTLFLLLSALEKSIEKTNIDMGITGKKIKNRYLFNSDEDGEDRFKLILTQTDKKNLNNLLDDKEISNKASQGNKIIRWASQDFI